MIELNRYYLYTTDLSVSGILFERINLTRVILSAGEIPKWLKGLPWKGSRSLIAARGFKSLFLRFDYKELERKKNLTIRGEYVKIIKLLTTES